MLEKKISAKAGRVLKTGSMEEEQAKELKALEDLFPEQPVAEESEKEQETDDDETSETASE